MSSWRDACWLAAHQAEVRARGTRTRVAVMLRRVEEWHGRMDALLREEEVREGGEGRRAGGLRQGNDGKASGGGSGEGGGETGKEGERVEACV